MTNTRCDVVFVTDTDYKVVFASVQSWQVVAVVVVGGGGNHHYIFYSKNLRKLSYALLDNELR